MSRILLKGITFVLILVLSSAVTDNCFADSVRAFSLREADRLVQAGKADDRELAGLAGITRVAGMVFDRDTGDVILVGKVCPGQPTAMIRPPSDVCRLKYGQPRAPLVGRPPSGANRSERLGSNRNSTGS